MRSKTCPICDSELASNLNTFEYLNAGPHKHPLFENLLLESCGSCESAWANSAPSNDDLGAYYARNYSPARMGFVDKDRWPIWDSRHATLLVLSRLVTSFKKGDYFVDVGPGNGASLSLAPLLLPRPRIGCVELNEKSIQFFHRHVPDLLVYGSVKQLESKVGQESIKLVLSAHSLEHFRPNDLVAELTKIYGILSVGGALAIEVPFSPSVKTANVRRHTPHLIFFSEEGLTRLLSRIGFDVKLCFKAVGRTKWGQEYMQENFSIPPNYPKFSQKFMERLSALNVGDLVASDSPAENSPGVVLKCIAVKPSLSNQ